MTSRFPKKSLILCGCAVYLAYALVWGLRQREQFLAEAEYLASCRDAPAAVTAPARVAHEQPSEKQPALGAGHVAMSKESSWMETRTQ
jgi:hypothetical protein